MPPRPSTTSVSIQSMWQMGSSLRDDDIVLWGKNWFRLKTRLRNRSQVFTSKCVPSTSSPKSSSVRVPWVDGRFWRIFFFAVGAGYKTVETDSSLRNQYNSSKSVPDLVLELEKELKERQIFDEQRRKTSTPPPRVTLSGRTGLEVSIFLLFLSSEVRTWGPFLQLTPEQKRTSWL